MVEGGNGGREQRQEQRRLKEKAALSLSLSQWIGAAAVWRREGGGGEGGVDADDGGGAAEAYPTLLSFPPLSPSLEPLITGAAFEAAAAAAFRSGKPL